jgi:ketosteroid isomerase-like protein
VRQKSNVISRKLALPVVGARSQESDRTNRSRGSTPKREANRHETAKRSVAAQRRDHTDSTGDCSIARLAVNIPPFSEGISMRLLLCVALLTSVSSVPAFADNSCGLLHRQTQTFSDAGQRGDGAAMAKMLDPKVIFFNETGEKATRADMAGATPPAAGTLIRSITATDWDCRVYGDVAVTSFIDVLEQGNPSEMKFRSVETWRKEGAAWKMIGSETLSLPEDPEAVALDANTLDEYAGSYEAGGSLKFTFARKAGNLVASLNGGAETVQKAQLRDIFFTPGHGTTPKVFQRGDDGKITGFVFLRGKNSIVFKRVV